MSENRFWQMRPAFAIFDMDGTLVNSMEYWTSLGSEYLKSKGVSDEAAAPVLAVLENQTISESSALMVKTYGWQRTPEQVADEINGLMQEHYRRDVQLKNGVKEYLRRLHEAGTRCCVASASAPDNVRICLTRLGVADDFEFALSSEDYGSKAEPDIYFACAKRFGAQPGAIWVYEDALYAVKTAEKAGFHTVGVLDRWTKEKWPKIREAADVLTEDFQNFCAGTRCPESTGEAASGGLDSLHKRK